MLVIRLQRTGRKGHAQFRIIVQDSRRTPSSGAIVAGLGSYNPHDKSIVIDKEKAQKYLNNGAQPSDRVAYLLQSQGVELPSWVKLRAKQERAVRNPEKRRSTQPAAEVAEPAPQTVTEVSEAPAAAEATETAEA